MSVFFKRVIALLAFVLSVTASQAQCPTGNVTGNVTISSNCTINSSLTITGNLTLNADLTLGTGVVLTVGGTLNNGYRGSATNRTISGGTLNVNTVSTGDNIKMILTNTTVNVTTSYYGAWRGGLTMTNSTLDIGTSFSEGFSTGTISLDNSTIETGTSFATSGGGTQLSLTNGSSIDAGTTFSFTGGSGRTLTVNNSDITSGGNFTIGEQSAANFTNGALITVTSGTLLNDNGADILLDNADIVVSSGNMVNDYQSTIIAQNGSNITLSSGNLQTYEQSSLYIDASDVYVNGNFNNHYEADLDIVNGGTLTITGDFNNGADPAGGEVTNGHVNVNGGSVSVGGDLNNEYGSNITIDGDGDFAVVGDVKNDQASTIDVPSGTFSYGGTMTDPYGGVSSSSSDSECSDGCCGSGCDALPVTLVEFKVTRKVASAELKWATATEIDNDFFTLEKSIDGVNFFIIAKLDGSGTTKEAQSYAYVDADQSNQKVCYYRLSQTDFDGTYEQLKVVVLSMSKQDLSINVVPNVITSNRAMEVRGATADMSWKIVTLSGQLLDCGSFINGNELEVGHIDRGTYLLSVVSQSGIATKKFIVK